jgi:cell fate regulator YaaT (PSP1 superfamily)
MKRIVKVKLENSGRVIYCDASNFYLKNEEAVIVEIDRCLDYGRVISDPNSLFDKKPEEPLRKIVRIGSAADLKQAQVNCIKAKEAFGVCFRKIQEHKLNMKLINAQYSFDRSKIIFYFTAEGRIDFRHLVKDLAKIFKARIELRQIGARDEARFFGGFGPCGRQLCCRSFLKDFTPVTIKMAKEENLPLNPSKISGLCGRLMCCLAYEYEGYKLLSRGLPREGDYVHTAEGKGKVISVNILKRSVTVELPEGKQIELRYK